MTLSIKDLQKAKKLKTKSSEKNIFKFGNLTPSEIEERHIVASLSSEVFYRSGLWKAFKSKVFKKFQNGCFKCGFNKDLEIIHIKPRSIYPELAFDPSNIKIICASCIVIKEPIAPKIKVRRNS